MSDIIVLSEVTKCRIETVIQDAEIVLGELDWDNLDGQTCDACYDLSAGLAWLKEKFRLENDNTGKLDEIQEALEVHLEKREGE